jgi:Phosphotransferase enzyme family
MLAPPDDLTKAALVSALEHGWGMAAASMEYRPVGWGSHHWDVTDTDGSRWFVTADELDKRQLSEGEPFAATSWRLRGALAAARALHDSGRAFVVAPVPASDGEPLVRLENRFTVAVYPFIDGKSFQWGEFFPAEHRLGVLEMVVAVHTAPATVRRHALADEFGVAFREELEAARDSGAEAADCGPYARSVSLLVRQNAPAIRGLLARYDDLVRRARAQPGRAVLTHGEIHPGNTMLTAGGWRLIDWDTALAAPPERDLWNLDPGDGTILEAYAGATGVVPEPSLLDLYRLRWDITDLAMDVSRFRRPHTGTADDDKSWDLLNSLIKRISG